MKVELIYVAAAAALLGGLAALPAHASNNAQSATIHPNGTDNDPSVASWATKCDYLGKKHLDPIKHHGEPAGQSASDHDHLFFGGLTTSPSAPHPDQFSNLTNGRDNDWLRARSAEQTFGSTGERETYGCAKPDQAGCDPNTLTNPTHPCMDGSLYWFPALYLNDTDRTNRREVTAAWAFAYYRNEDIDPRQYAGTLNGMQPMPDWLSMVGKSGSTSGQGIGTVEWSCIQGTDKQGSLLSAYTDYIPSSCTYDTQDNYAYLRVVVKFPNCIKKSTPDYQAYHDYTPDITYATANTTPGDPWPMACPADYYPIPQLGLGVRWRLDSGLFNCAPQQPPSTKVDCNFSTVQLASDPPSARGIQRGVSAHADFMSGWRHDDMGYLMRKCFYAYTANHPDPNQHINCGVV